MGLLACDSSNVTSDPFCITEKDLKEQISKKDLTFVFFYTSWCGGSNYNYENYVLPYHKKIIKTNTNAQILMIAGDDAVSEEKIKEIKNEGILSYRLSNAGAFPPKNRYKIRKFIESAFPNQEVEQTKGFGFAIPVDLIINKKGEILNLTDSIDSYGILYKYIEENK